MPNMQKSVINNIIKSDIIGKDNIDTVNKDTKDKDTLLNELSEKILFRFAGTLTKEDFETIETLDNEDSSGLKSQKYIETKIPNFAQIIIEELNLLKNS